MGFLPRNSEFDDLEHRLQAERAEPPQELVASLSDRVSSHHGGHRRERRVLRYGVAAGFAASLTVAFAVAGGFGLMSESTRSTPRVTVAVPAALAPTIRSLQASGARLVAQPIGIRVGTASVTAIPGTGVLQLSVGAARIDTQRPIVTTRKALGGSGSRATGKSSSAASLGQRAALGPRTLVPQVTASTDAIRFSALDVYNPPPDTVICLATYIPPPVDTTYYTTLLVSAPVAAALIAQNPGSYLGPCQLPPT